MHTTMTSIFRDAGNRHDIASFDPRQGRSRLGDYAALNAPKSGEQARSLSTQKLGVADSSSMTRPFDVWGTSLGNGPKSTSNDFTKLQGLSNV